MKYWIVMERGWNYNDEYYVSEDNAGHPKRVFTDCEKAEKYCQELERKWLTSIDVTNYGYSQDSLREALLQEEFITKGEAEKMRHWEASPDFSHLWGERQQRFMEICRQNDIWGYEVVGVEG